MSSKLNMSGIIGDPLGIEAFAKFMLHMYGSSITISTYDAQAMLALHETKSLVMHKYIAPFQLVIKLEDK